MSSKPNPVPNLVTRLLNRRDKAHTKAREAANDSSKVNRRAKTAFHNTVNDTMRNPSISAKKKFSILLKLMKNNKHCNIPPLIENDITVQDPTEQSNIFNKFFASKSTVQNPNDPVPNLERKADISTLNSCQNNSQH